MIEELTGTVITKADKSYNILCRNKNLYFSYYPRVIVYPNNIKDVANAVNWARNQGLNVRCRSGGHNYESFSVENDVVVIDVSNLLDFEIDTNLGYVRIGTGYRLGELYSKIAEYGVGLRSTAKEMEKALSLLLKVANKISYTIEHIDFKKYVNKYSSFVSTPKGFKNTGLLAYKLLEKEPCKILFDYLDNSPQIQQPIEIEILLLGGRIAENKYLSSAYPHREAKVLIQIIAQWEIKYSIYANDTVKWVNNLRESLLPYADFGYLNYCDINMPKYLYNYFGNNVSWLKIVKERYDPYNLFYYPQGINL